MKPRFISSLEAVTASFVLFCSSAGTGTAATLTWDTAAGDQSTITPGSGAWNLTAGNAVWNNAGTNVIWSQTSVTDGSNAALFEGTDGTLNQRVVTLAAQMAAESVAFNASGYQITGGTLALMPTTTTSGAITVAVGKTATIDSILRYAHNTVANVSVGSGGILNLGGGTTASNNPQWLLSGAGTINLTGGTFTNNIGNFNAASINLTAGTHAITPGNSNAANIGSAAGQSVNYTVSGAGTLTVNNNAATGTGTGFSALRLGFGDTAAHEARLTVRTGGTVTIGSGKYGELQIAGSATSNGKLDVQGGAVTIAAGVPTANKIYFFKNGSNPGYSAAMTQSGGSVTANGIQFGGDTGSHDATSSATLQLSGGSLLVGAQGITRGSAASALPIAIQLLGGSLGASAAWSSPLDMKLGSATIRAANSGGTAQNINLSGVLSDDVGAGTLTKTGSGTLTLSGTGDNTFTGATLVSEGTLNLGKVNAVSSSSSVTIADGAALSLSTTPGKVKTLTFTNAGTLGFDLAGGGTTLTVDTADGVTNGGGSGSVTIDLTGMAPANGTYTLISYSGALQGSGFGAYKLGRAPAGKSYTLQHATNAVQVVVSSAYNWTGAQSSEWSTQVIAPSKNWNLDGSPVDYTNGTVVIFDDAATNKTVTITGADMTPDSVLFNSGIYTLQGSNGIAGPAPVTIAAAATLKLGSSNVLPDGAGTGNVTLNGTLDLNGNSETINGLLGNGTVDNTAATTSTLTVGAHAGGAFSGTIQNSFGTLALTKTGATDVSLSGINTYSGDTTVSRSRLFINSATALSSSTAVTVANGAFLVLNASGTPAFAQNITLASGSHLSARLAASCTNVILPNQGDVIFNFDDVATQVLTLAGGCTLGGSLDVQVGGGAGAPGNVALSGILSGSGGSLVKTGPGRLVLRGANTFDGGVTIRNGTLESTTTTTTLGTGVVTMGGADSNGATFLTGQNNSNPFTITAPGSGSIVIGANGGGSGFTMSGGITLNGDLTIRSYDNIISGTVTARSFFTGGVTGTGNLLLDNPGLAANEIRITGANAVNHTGSITVQGSATGATTISAPVGANVTGITQNSATSTLVLSGTNTYAGNTTVNAGTLRITQAPDPANANTGNDASTVAISASGATLDLTYSGTDKVGKLIIGTTEQANGVYGRVGSASPVIGIPQITGDGTLTVGTSGLVFAAWINGSFANGQVAASKQGPADDPDGDGISNLIEFAIEGQDPTLPNSSIAISSGSTMSFNKRQTPAATGISYAIEESTDLGSADDWDEVSGANYVNNPTTISYSSTPGSPPRNFLRLKVSQ